MNSPDLPPLDQQRPRIVFLHLPKTAGTTVHDILIQQFSAEEICPERHDKIERFSPEKIESFKLFSMHGYFNTILCIPEPKKIVTIFREPIERLLSHYQYWCSHTVEYLEKTNQNWLSTVKKSDFKAYLKNTQFTESENPIYRSLYNVMTRQMCHFELNKNGQPWRDDQEILDAALENLEKMDAFGIMEFLPESIDLMCRTLDIPPPQKIAALNNTRENHQKSPDIFEPPPPLTIDDEVEELLRHRTRLDTILYEAAKEKFLKQIGVRPRKLSANNHIAGQLVHHYKRSVVHSQVNEPGHILFGPYINLRSGTYRITVEIGTDSLADGIEMDTPLAELDVCSGTGQNIHAQRWVCAKDLKPGFYSPVELIFTLEKTVTEFEVRVNSLGRAALSINTEFGLDTL
ncbi:hypothetical protein H4S14_002415 [Agrobacterium vitis]|nr:hypothetical protein [Agrobacterium vitis]MBE1438665.1 hypothetical protein [Agrobacterium vitis]